MLQSIEIENFRCFEKTAISGFEQINLVTGKNNSGKTALLEALYLALTTDSKNLTENTRQSENDSEKEKNLYFNQNDRNPIKILIFFEQEGPFSNQEGIRYEYLKANSSQHFFNEVIQETGRRIFHSNHYNVKTATAFIFDKNRQLPNNQELTYLLDSIDKKGEKFRIIEALKIIDESLSDIRTFASFSGVLYILKNGFSEYQPVYYLGDAVQKIVRYVINILSSYPNKDAINVLLIDEIENGIHYTAQAEVWRMLLKLCKHYNIQLFATTHSLEMIKAFQQVCSEEEFTGMGGYFELGRQAKSQQIIGIKHKLTTLEYELATDSPIRGE